MESILIIAIALCSVQQIAAVPQIQGRIFGGSEVDINEVPYQVFLAFNGKPFCGGAIISPSFIFTSAHCTRKMKYIDKVIVTAGTSDTTYGGISRKVQSVTWHRKYDDATQDHDYCLLELDSPLEFSESVNAVGLPIEYEVPYTGEKCVVSGWGFTGNSPEKPTNLHVASVSIVDKDSCRANLEFPVTDQMVCAGSYQKNVGACGGDCGGPLVCSGKLVGLVSWGFMENCELPIKPTVYAAVAMVKGWVRGVAGI